MRVLFCFALLLLLSFPLSAQDKISRADRAKMRETRETMSSLQADLATLNQLLDNKYPAELKELVDNKMREVVPTDAWGREFAYEVSATEGYKLTSWGADGKSGGDAAARDIVWTARGELREMSSEEKAEYEARLDEQRFQATRVIARRRMVKVGGEIVNYRRTNSKWPEKLEDCRRAGMEGEDVAINQCFVDPFGHEFGLRLLPHDNFAVVCWGADGAEGGLERESDFVITERDVRAEYNVAAMDPWGWGNYDDTDWRVQNLADDVKRYKQRFGSLPNELVDLTRGGKPVDKEGEGAVVQAIRSSLPKDRWGNDYVYVKLTEEEFFIVGLGKDGIEGGIKDNEDAIHPKPGANPNEEDYEEDWGGAVMVEPEPEDDDVLVEIATELMFDIIDKLKAYHAEHGSYPASLDDIKQQLVDGTVPLDPWEHSFIYTLTKDAGGAITGFTLTSYGSDSAEGGDGHAADITFNQNSEPEGEAPEPEDN